jgi:hypothetical protein
LVCCWRGKEPVMTPEFRNLQIFYVVIEALLWLTFLIPSILM